MVAVHDSSTLLTCHTREWEEGRADMAEWGRAPLVHLVDVVARMVGNGVRPRALVQLVLKMAVDRSDVRSRHQMEAFPHPRV